MKATAIEKARELIAKAYLMTGLYTKAKAVALFCVAEILKTIPQKENEIFGVSKGIEYWKEVEQEIEKLK